MSPSINLDLITSDQYAQAYLHHLFSDKGPVAELENYFVRAGDKLRTLRTEAGCTNKTEVRHLKDLAQDADGEGGKGEDKSDRRGRQDECEQRDESLQLSIVETQPDESLDHSATT